jgi:hypothetical protein
MVKTKGKILISLLLGLALTLVASKEAKAVCCIQYPAPPLTGNTCTDRASCLAGETTLDIAIYPTCTSDPECPQYNPNQGNTNNTNTNGGGNTPTGGNTAMGRLKNVLQSSPSYSLDKTNEYSLTDYVGLLISVFLGLLGIIFIILLIYGGFTWMIAAGNAEKVSKAGRVIRAAILGLLITIAVYAMWYFLFAKIVTG